MEPHIAWQGARPPDNPSPAQRAHHFSSMLPRLENWAATGAPLKAEGKGGSRFRMARSRMWPVEMEMWRE